MQTKPPVPPFTAESALQKVQAAEDAWNTKDPVKVSLAYTEDTSWRNRAEFVNGREAVQQFLTKKWNRELDYRLKKELWAYTGNRIAVTFRYVPLRSGSGAPRFAREPDSRDSPGGFPPDGGSRGVAPA